MTSPQAPTRRPMAYVRRIGLFRREIIERISQSAIDLLLASAGRISEGQLTPDNRYFGSTMLTIDFETLRERVSGLGDLGTAARVARQLSDEPQLRRRVSEIACAEALRISRTHLAHLDTELRVRAEGNKIFIDVDVDAHAAAQIAG